MHIFSIKQPLTTVCLLFVWVVSILVMTLVARVAAAYPLLDDNTPGAMALAYKKRSNVWLRLDVGGVDGKVTSSPPDTTKLDRRLESLYILGFDALLTNRFGLRINGKGEYSMRRQLEDEGPTADVRETWQQYRPSADITFVTDQGLELFGGMLYQHTPGYEQTVQAGEVESSTTYGTTSLQVKRLGAVRRSGPWSGGFYYVMGEETKRTFDKKASDGTGLSGEEIVFVPSEVAVFGEFEAGTVLWNFELSFVQARGFGEKDENGSTIYTDYFQANMGSYYELAGGLGVSVRLAHQTLSYANHAYVDLSTIPVTAVKALLIMGDADGHFHLGVQYAEGQDGQSIPEFNATYLLQAASMSLGFHYPL